VIDAFFTPVADQLIFVQHQNYVSDEQKTMFYKLFSFFIQIPGFCRN